MTIPTTRAALEGLVAAYAACKGKYEEYWPDYLDEPMAAADAALKAEPEGEGPSVEQVYYWALKSIYKYGSDTLSEQADDRGWLRAAVAEMVRRAQESLDYGTPVAPPAPEDLAADQAMAANLRDLLIRESGLHSGASSAHYLLQRCAAMLVNYGLPAHPAATPAPEPSEDRTEETAKLIYTSMRFAVAEEGRGSCDWVERGNSLMQDEARRTARAILAGRDCPTTPPAPETGETEKTKESVTHDLKVWSSYFESLLDGTKNFEVRFNDRDFKSGHYLRLREWLNNEYTGRELTKRVTYVLQGGVFGLEAGYVALALAAKQVNDFSCPTLPAPAEAESGLTRQSAFHCFRSQLTKEASSRYGLTSQDAEFDAFTSGASWAWATYVTAIAGGFGQAPPAGEVEA